ncbi:MAG: acyltransferase family protein [Hyphomonadaceae bacterium]
MSADAALSGLTTDASSFEARRHTPQHRTDIQGLRAIAVLSVVVFHAIGAALPGGFVGVDIFFVISGYLISGILMDEMESGRFSLGAFYERRVRRLFPALFVMLACVLVAGLLLLPAWQMAELGHTGLSTIFFVSNFDLFSMSGYFDSEAQTRPLLHTWSLAVEEQFYLLFPLVLLFLVRLARKWMRLILLVSALASLGLCLWALQHNAAAAFYLAPFRGYELIIGALLSRLPFPTRAPAWLRDALSVMGLAMIAASLFLINGDMAFPGLAALLPCTGAALVLITGAGGGSLGGRLISNPVSSFFGGISYSLYLWHWPVLVLGRALLLATPTPLQTLAMIALAVSLAAASWKWIEQPFLKRRSQRTTVLVAGGAAMVLGAMACGSIVVAQGLPARFGPEAQHLFEAREDFNPRRPECHHYLASVTPYASNCKYGAMAAAPSAAMWSDSHGTELVVAIGEHLANEGEAMLGITSSACPPAVGYASPGYPLCAAQNDVTLTGLVQDARIKTVYMAAYFSGYAHNDWPAIAAGFERSVETLTHAGKHVVLIYPIPVFDQDVPTTLGVMKQRGEDAAAYSIPWPDFAGANRNAFDLLNMLREKFGAAAIHPEQTLCRVGRCFAYDREAGPLYFNRDHLSLAGARLVLRDVEIPAISQPTPVIARVKH